MEQRETIETKNGAKDFRTDRIAASDIGQNDPGNYAMTRQQSPNVRRPTCYISIGYTQQQLGMCFALHISMLATNLMEGKKMETAYDYDKQEWILGDKAKALRLLQLAETLELLQGPQGDEYAKFIESDKQAAIDRTVKEIEHLTAC